MNVYVPNVCPCFIFRARNLKHIFELCKSVWNHILFPHIVPQSRTISVLFEFVGRNFHCHVLPIILFQIRYAKIFAVFS